MKTYTPYMILQDSNKMWYFYTSSGCRRNYHTYAEAVAARNSYFYKDNGTYYKNKRNA